MKEVGLNVKYLHGYKGTWAPEFYKALGPDAEGILMDGFWSEDLPNPGAKELGARYAKQYNKHSVSIGLFYGLCQILWEAIEKAGSTDYDAISKALKTEMVETPLGKIKFDENGDATGIGFSVYQVQNGAFVQQ
jgi:branched-chain amino acid transport system substrate-binding protein